MPSEQQASFTEWLSAKMPPWKNADLYFSPFIVIAATGTTGTISTSNNLTCPRHLNFPK